VAHFCNEVRHEFLAETRTDLGRAYLVRKG